jgi:hypothetical protein
LIFAFCCFSCAAKTSISGNLHGAVSDADRLKV